MTPRLTGLFRYPVKGIGREPLETVDLTPGAPLPGDRAWALRHEASEAGDGWLPRRNFLVVASGPQLAQVTAKTDGDQIVLTHPGRADLTLNPASDGPALIDWVTPLWPTDRPQPTTLVPAPAEGMADNGLAQISILNLASLRALSQKLGRPVAVERFRGNLIVDGLPPWGEFDWIGQTIQIGPVTFDITDRIERCRATEANPDTGQRDIDPCRGLRDGWGHRDFGVYGTVQTSGRLSLGDAVIE